MNIWPGFSIRTSLNKERAGRREAILLVSGVLLLVLAAASICMGAVPVTLRELAEALTTGETATSAGPDHLVCADAPDPGCHPGRIGAGSVRRCAPDCAE